MKKISFAAFMVVAALFAASCGKTSGNGSSVEEMEIEKTGYAITKMISGDNVSYGVKKGHVQVIENSYAGIVYDHGFFVADFVAQLSGVDISGKRLLKPDDGKMVLSGDSIFYHPEGYFISQSLDKSDLYFPETDISFFALNDYVVSDNIVLSKGFEDWGAYTIANDTILGPYYKQIVLLKEKKSTGYLIVQDGVWLRLNAQGEAISQVSPAELRKLKRHREWRNDTPAFVLNL